MRKITHSEGLRKTQNFFDFLKELHIDQKNGTYQDYINRYIRAFENLDKVKDGTLSSQDVLDFNKQFFAQNSDYIENLAKILVEARPDKLQEKLYQITAPSEMSFADFKKLARQDHFENTLQKLIYRLFFDNSVANSRPILTKAQSRLLHNFYSFTLFSSYTLFLMITQKAFLGQINTPSTFIIGAAITLAIGPILKLLMQITVSKNDPLYDALIIKSKIVFTKSLLVLSFLCALSMHITIKDQSLAALFFSILTD